MLITKGEKHTLYNADCMDILPAMASGSVDLIIADIPYFQVAEEEWDNQWESLAQYQAWVEAWGREAQRVLSHSGSMYIFTDEKHGAYVQVVLDKLFLLLNNIVWYKTNNLPIKNVRGLRSWASMTERILFYTHSVDSPMWVAAMLRLENFAGLRAYFKEYQEALGLSIKQINEILGDRRAEHAFYWGSTQWGLPTEETYRQLGELDAGNFVRRPYADLVAEYQTDREKCDDARRPLRRVWNTEGDTLDVITGPIITQAEGGYHVTQKPVWLLERLIKASSNPGDVVLDFTCGSGSTGVAALHLRREFIGIEQDAGNYEKAVQRLAGASGERLRALRAPDGQLSLFG